MVYLNKFKRPSRIRIAILAFPLVCIFTSCSESNHVAGTIIETNTGNQGTIIETNSGNVARTKFYVSASALEIQAGDTLVLERTDTLDVVLGPDSTADTLFVARYHYQKVVDSLDCSAGIMELDSVPTGVYDSVAIFGAGGDNRIVAVEWELKEIPVNYDNVLEIENAQQISITLDSSFIDLSSTEEIFENMPFAIGIPASIEKPCLMDSDGNLILLDFAEGLPSQENNTQANADTTYYWGVMPYVIFASENSITFNVIPKCQQSNNIHLPLGRLVEHFDQSFTMDSSNSTGYLITEGDKDFTPFVEDNRIGVSFWIKADSSEQIYDYARIIGAKSDGVGFNVQQRGDRGSINLRIDARNRLDSLSSATYNEVYGTAPILDGTWHHYAFTIKGDSIKVYADGILIDRSSFVQGEGFKNITNPLVGGDGYNLIGSIDEIFFFDGTQSENWMRLHYALQKMKEK